MRWARRTWSRWRRLKLDGTGVMCLMSWSAMGSTSVDQSQARNESHVSHLCANVRNFVGLVPQVMRYLSSEHQHQKNQSSPSRGNCPQCRPRRSCRPHQTYWVDLQHRSLSLSHQHGARLSARIAGNGAQVLDDIKVQVTPPFCKKITLALSKRMDKWSTPASSKPTARG